MVIWEAEEACLKASLGSTFDLSQSKREANFFTYILMKCGSLGLEWMPHFCCIM